MPLADYAARVPPKNRENGVPLSEMSGEKQEVIRRKIVYDMRPLMIMCALIWLCFLTAFVSFTVQQLSANATARACFAASGSWQINEQGRAECLMRNG